MPDIFVHDFVAPSDATNASIVAVVSDSTAITDSITVIIPGIGLEWIDGFDYWSGNASNVVLRYDADSGATNFQSPGGPYGGGAIGISANGGQLYLRALGVTGSSRGLLSQSVSKSIGFSYLSSGSSFPNPNNPIFSMLDGATTQIDVRYDSGGHLYVTRNGTTLGTATVAILNGVWYYLELAVTIDSVAGSVSLVLNSSLPLVTLSGINTQATANAWINGVALIGPETFVFDHTFIDNLYIRNDTTLMGEVRVLADEPISDGDTTQWIPNSGTTHFNRVNSDDGDSTYDSDSQVGDVDLVGYPAFSALGGRIQATQVVVAARKDNAGNRDVSPIMKSNGILSVGPVFGGLTTGYVYRAWIQPTDPGRGAPWSELTIGQVQLGAKVVS